MQKLVKDLYIETGYPGVTVGAVITKEGIICIDAPTRPTDARDWRAKLATLSPLPIRYVILLDHHRDRIMGCQWLDAAAVVAHELTHDRIRQFPELQKGNYSDTGMDVDLTADIAGVRLVAPHITFTQRMTLALGQREVQLVHSPGAAAGAIWVWVDNVVFTGDTFTKNVPPFLAEAQFETWLNSIAQLRKLRPGPKTIVPGRGGALDKDGLKATEDFLKLARRKFEAFVKSKKPRNELVELAKDLLGAYTVTADLRDHYTRRLRLGLEALYDTQVPLKPA